ncbi:MAG: isoprenylcysteine carboxylmethyltransferase family protein, partial [Desulfobacteraceae bacterium]
GTALIPLVAGLDAIWGEQHPFDLKIKMIALFIMLTGHALGYYAMFANRFFSGMVRIQTDRGHHVVSSGPYCWIRHPGYVGALLANLVTPLLLDSYWAFVPTIFLSVVLIVRTYLEDSALQNELPGYSDYAKQVRYRLLPGVW